MNERIKDLKEQALCWAVETLDPDALNDNEWGVAIDAKFAELIVRECIDIISPYAVRMSRPGEEYLHPIQEILEHFGVEE